MDNSPSEKAIRCSVQWSNQIVWSNNIAQTPSPRWTNNFLISLATAVPGRFMGYALLAGGEWSGDLLIADSDDLEKKHRLRSRRPERFKSQEVQVTTAHGHTSCHVMMDLLSKKDTSSLDLSVTDNFKKEDDDAGGQSNADDQQTSHPLRHEQAGGNSDAGEHTARNT